jgi:hypothetical protein
MERDAMRGTAGGRAGAGTMDVEAERVIQCVYARRCKKCSDENTDLSRFRSVQASE